VVIINSYVGRFGNNILQYYNLIQLSKFLDVNPSSVYWNDSENFNDIIGETKSNRNSVTYQKNMSKNYLKDIIKENNLIINGVMGDLFFEFDDISTFDVFNLKIKPNIEYENSKTAVHFRGGDFRHWANGNGILPLDYYINSVSMVLEDDNDTKFYLYTDDKTLNNFNGLVGYMRANNINHEISNNDYIQDFSNISDCDYIISNPSTFTICASFIGKRNKKIIHSNKWFEYAKNDMFWNRLNNGGNGDYKLWKKI